MPAGVPIDETVLRMLRCPVSGQSLQKATAEELQELGVDLPEGGFLTEDRHRAYPIENGLPVLKPEDAVEISSCD